MKIKITLATFFLTLICLGLFAQIPLVYNKENTGAAFKLPALPTIDKLPIVDPLPDPFMWSDGKGRSTKFSDWEHRRNEIKAEIESYEKTMMAILDDEDAIRTAKNEGRNEGLSLQDISDITGLSSSNVEELSNQ